MSAELTLARIGKALGVGSSPEEVSSQVDLMIRQVVRIARAVGEKNALDPVAVANRVEAHVAVASSVASELGESSFPEAIAGASKGAVEGFLDGLIDAVKKDFRPKSVTSNENDPINPKHYKLSPSGVEAITVIEHMSFNVGTACKYLWRQGLKTPDPIEDLKKAIWYIQREVERLEKAKT